MYLHRILLILAVASVACAQMTTEQKVADFTSMSQFYARHYTPANWKIVQFGFDLRDLRPWLEQVRSTKSDVEYFDVAIDYLSKLQDGHIRYTLPSNYQAYLGFDTDFYDGKALVEFIAPAFNRREFPLAIGDELVSLDGLTPEQWMPRLARYSIGANESATRRRALDFVTFRPQFSIPWAAEIGETARVVIRKADGTEVTYDIPWVKRGTAIKNLPSLAGPRLASGEALSLRDATAKYEQTAQNWGIHNGLRPKESEESWTASEREARGIQMAVAHPVDVALTALGQFSPLYNPPPGFRLRLGAAATDQFLSGTFLVDGKTVGWIRIPSFSPSNTTLALQQFRAEMAAMQGLSSGLVIDVMHNPGGNLCYAQELVRYLVSQPFWGVGYWIKPTQSWKVSFESRALAAQTPAVAAWERTLLNEYYSILSEAFDRSEETGIFPICAASVTTLPQDVVYTKPVMLLTNEFSISAGDTFPMLIQDAGRGKIVGMRTGGLGGNVNDYFSTGATETSLRVTRSLIIRERAVPSPYGPTRFIENVGVQPDVKLDLMTRENLLNGGRTFVEGWIEEVKKMLQ
jgi:hypothetical protein